MSRAFALWVTSGLQFNLRGPAFSLSGAALGRAPDTGQGLTVLAPFSKNLRTRFRSLAGEPRGGTLGGTTILVEAIDKCSPASLEGAVLVEEGVTSQAFAARSSNLAEIAPTPARFDLGSDRGYGLIRSTRGFLNGVLIGGGLGGRSFWESLRTIEPVGRPDLQRSELRPFPSDPAKDIWAVPSLRRYSPVDEKEWIVLRSMGPVVGQTEVSVLLDGDWRDADVVQQASGRLTQLEFARSPGADMTHVIVPLRSAA